MSRIKQRGSRIQKKQKETHRKIESVANPFDNIQDRTKRILDNLDIAAETCCGTRLDESHDSTCRCSTN